MDSRQSHPLTIPGAIIIAAAIIAVALIYALKPAGSIPTAQQQQPKQEQKVVINVSPVKSSDHILGNPNAPIRIVEFSDPSCPFCKQFHPTMRSIMNTYGPTGNVAWIYRSFPLDNPDSQGRVLHPNAGHESQAFECAASLGGNDAFWKFANKVYEITPSDQGKSLDQKELPNIAKGIGLNVVAFNECLSSGTQKDKVESQYMDGINAGVSGTPTSIFILSKAAPASLDQIISDLSLKGIPIVMSSDRMKILMSGAMPESVLKAVLEPLIANLK